jgi:predicted nucleic acid-binding protein
VIVVCDTSPLTALLTVGEENLLPRIFDEVVIPEAVRDELLRNHARLPVCGTRRKLENTPNS